MVTFGRLEDVLMSSGWSADLLDYKSYMMISYLNKLDDKFGEIGEMKDRGYYCSSIFTTSCCIVPESYLD